MDDSLLSGENATFIDQQYSAWLKDPASVDPHWNGIFESWGRPASAHLPLGPTARRTSLFASGPPAAAMGHDAALIDASTRRQAKVAQLINAYRVRGHIVAQVDPLGVLDNGTPAELDPAFFDLGEHEMDLPVHRGPLSGEPEQTTARRVLARLKAAYCARIGVEYMNIHDIVQRRWVQERIETIPDQAQLDGTRAQRFLRKLSDAESFEQMLQQRFPGTKRFSLEGGETLIPLLDLALDEAAQRGVKEATIGMSHRGRLNVLANVLDKPIKAILAEFQDVKSDTFEGSGDVKYHLGYSSDHLTASGRTLHLSLTPNPSHLEAVDPVVEGRVRAKLDRYGDSVGTTCLPILLHGDAAFIGQGIVAEVLNLSGLTGYQTGGTLHIVVNNQIGFTTAPHDSRSGHYATDIARMLAIPIFHVNGEDPEAVAAVVRIAAEWRAAFHRDVVIDLYCYRKHGHNESDEPGFTQPVMYDAIRKRATPRQNCAERLVNRQLVSSADVAHILHASRQAMEDGATRGAPPPDTLQSSLKQLWRRWAGGSGAEPHTSLPIDRLRSILERANTVPADFALHPKLSRLLLQRLEMMRGTRRLDWATAEQAAYGSLVLDGFRVRLTGQDVGRGTFSQRHAVLTDIRTQAEHLPLQHLAETQGVFQAFDSPLSEYAVLGFEFGYSWDYPDALVLWEAQFGDFVNGAQTILDQFVVASEQKWNRASGLVLLLPHGYEGQGPEHSSARPERLLQLCGEDNIQVANVTTPANLFHLLRRQCLRDKRKPLVVLEPKSLLRHPECTSALEDLATGQFQAVLPETEALDASKVRRVVLCTGKVYYDLVAARKKINEDRVAIVRVEMLYPFPADAIADAIAAWPDAEVVWCQEEPRNQGYWPMYDEWLREGFPARTIRYVGRKHAASPATGSHKKHEAEQNALVTQALSL